MPMQKFAVIGLGRFGSRLAANLAAAGHEVIGIDENPEIIEQMRDRVTVAVALDATDEQALKLQGVHTVEVAVLGIGDNFEATTLATVILKQLGVPRVIARATSHTAAQILTRIGADDVVNPEDESADRWTSRLITPHFLNQIEFHEGYSTVEAGVPHEWIGRSLADLDLRAKWGLHVVAIKRPRDPANRSSPVQIAMPGPTEPLRASDIVVLMGKNTDLERLARGR